jgi:hypothetical protein
MYKLIKAPVFMITGSTLTILLNIFSEGFFVDDILSILFNTASLLPLRFHCVGGCCDRTQNCCVFGSQMLSSLG